MDTHEWAKLEFGRAELDDERRTSGSFSMMAEVAARRPAGRLTEVFEVPAEREGAYRLVENNDVDPDAVAAAMFATAVEQSCGEDFVYVAEDQSTLTYTDTKGSRGTGPIGARHRGASGFEVMTSLAVSPTGVPIGIVGQRWWARAQEPAGDPAERQPHEKESRYWPLLIEDVDKLYTRAEGPRLCFQLDRGADDWQVWKTAVERRVWVTVRACHDRRLEVGRGQPREYLFATLANAPVAGKYRLRVPAGPGRHARDADMVVRHQEVHPRMVQTPTKQLYKPTLWAVSTEEEGTTPVGEKPIRWLLLTTRRVDGLADACQVIAGYSMRWRVELFHKAWKTGETRGEDSQLRDARAIRVWGTVLAAAALRLLRMTYLARVTPDAPAAVELSEEEVEAIQLVSQQARPAAGALTIADATLMIARIGGYTGKSSGGPPGFVVLARGWERVEPALIAIRNLRRTGCRQKGPDNW